MALTTMPEQNGEVEVKASEAEKLPEQQAAAVAATSSSPDAAAAAAVAEEPPTTTLASPILVFLNSASGGKMGPKVKEKIRIQIPDSQ